MTEHFCWVLDSVEDEDDGELLDRIGQSVRILLPI